MSKQRPYIPPPVVTPPGVASAPLVVVREPARVGSFQVSADRVEWTEPTIDLPESVWLKHELPHVQTRRLKPHKATVAHGLLIIEEYALTLPINGVEIRTAIKES